MQVKTLTELMGLGLSCLTGIETQLSYDILWSSSRHDGAINYVTLQALDLVTDVFFIPDQLKYLMFFDKENLKFLHSPIFPMNFRQMQNFLSSVMPKGVCQASLQLHSQFGMKNLQSI